MVESVTEWVTRFVPAFVGQVVGYLAFVGLAFLVTRRWAASRLAARRIETRGPRFDRGQLRHELRHSFGVLAIGTAQGLVVKAVLPDDAGASAPEPAGAGAMLFGLIVFNDVWFYATHRLLHTPWLFRHVHGVHHRSADVNPFSSYSFHWGEALLVTGWVLPVMLWMPIPMPVLAIAQVVGLLNNVGSHLGYELLPRWWVRAPVLRWTNSATFHALHHERFTGNFGLFSRVWDRLFGTEIADYEERFEAAHPADTPRRPR